MPRFAQPGSPIGGGPRPGEPATSVPAFAAARRLGRTLRREAGEAARALLRSRGTTFLAVLTLALALGAATTVFSVVEAMLLRPLPYRHPERLVRIESLRGGEKGMVALRELRDIRDGVSAVSGVASYLPGAQYNTSGDGATPEEVPATLCSSDLFPLLGVRPLHGGVWPESYDQDRSFGVVLSHGFWKRRFGGDPGVVGRKITLDGAPSYTVFGVLPPGFDLTGGVDLYRSIVIQKRDVELRDRRRVFGLARLRPGATLESAQAEVDGLARRLAQAYPETNREVGFRLTPLADLYVGEARPYLRLLLGAVGFLLLIACVNVVNLLLSRTLAREREGVIRAALGAGRGSLVRRGLLESLFLSLLGGAAGTLLALAGVRVAAASLGRRLPAWMEISLDGRVLVFAFAVASAAGLLAGLATAWRGSNPRLSSVLQEGARGSSAGRGQLLFRRGLIAAEIALALTLLAGAGWMSRALAGRLAVDAGFRTERLLTFRVALPWRTYDAAKTVAFYREALARLRALPGIASITTSDNPPLCGQSGSYRTTVAFAGQTAEEQRKNPYVDAQTVSPGYFETLGIPLFQGRAFTEADGPRATATAVVSRRLAARFWPQANPIGQRLRLGSADADEPWLEIVGVVGDVQRERLGDGAGLDLYLSLWQRPSANAFVLARVDGDPAGLAGPATRAVWSVDPDQSTFDFATLEERIAESFWRQRVSGTLCTVFALIATTLAAIGIFGVTRFAVGQRTREIGIRMALGAEPQGVLWMVLRETLAVLGVGLAAGLTATLGLAHLLGRLFGPQGGLDPWIPALVSLLVAAVTLLAAALPALRAARIDPLESLRKS